jgi:acyl carrier protein
MEVEEIKSKLKDIIVKELDANISEESVRGDVSLYEDGIGLDSISIVNFIVLVEKSFDITFNDAQISTATFRNIDTLSEHIYRQLGTQHLR